MTPSNETGDPLPENQDFKVNRTLLKTIVRERRGTWVACGLLILFVLLVGGLFLYPQSFASTVSISMQQPSPSTSALALLTGGGANKKYLGIIKSRRFAETVAKTIHLRELYRLPNTVKGNEEAVDRMIKGLKVDDNASDGLLYITVSVDGPARLAPAPHAVRDRAEIAAATAANLYSDELQKYIIELDVEKDLVLLRAAEVLLKRAEVNYDTAATRVSDFIKNRRNPIISNSGTEFIGGAANAGTSGGGTTSGISSGGAPADLLPTGTELQSLYVKRGQLQSQINAEDAVHNLTQKLLNSPNNELLSVPVEDPLLAAARRDYNDAANLLESLQIRYGTKMPSVRRQQQEVKLTKQRLDRQIESIRKGNTTAERKRQALQIEYDTVLRQIATAEKIVQRGRRTGANLDRLRMDLTISLEVLKTTATRYAELQLQTAAGKNRMIVVDSGRPPHSGKPETLLILLFSLFCAPFVIGLWAVIEYLIRAQAAGA